MQTIKIVAIRDRHAAVFSQPMYFATEGAAIRAFQDALNDTQSQMHKHPDDYDMYLLGEWNDTDGKFKNAELPTIIARGGQLKNA